MPSTTATYSKPGNYPITHLPLGPGTVIAPALGGSAPRTIMTPVAPVAITVNGTVVLVNLLQDDANVVVRKFQAVGIPVHLDSHGRLVLDLPAGVALAGDQATLQGLGLI